MKTTKFASFLFIVLMLAFTSCGPKDADIQKLVAEQTTAIGGVTAEVKEGVVTLTGEVKDDAAKTAAETAAKAVKGVKSVVNNLTVTPPPPPAPEITADEKLQQDVMDATKDYTTVKSEVKDGVVTLTGTIKKSDLPKLMQSISSLKPKKVENKLTTK